VSEPRVTLHLAGITDVGQLRDHNEDAFAVMRVSDRVTDVELLKETTVDDAGILLVVCDGMGGAAAGEVASLLAINTLTDVMGKAPTDVEGLKAESDLLRQRGRQLEHASVAANRAIFDEANNRLELSGMGTTMTAALLFGDQAVFAQVGDSRAYVLRGTELTQMTKDQSLVTQLLDSGQITREQARNFEHSNVILQALGVSEEIEVVLSKMTVRKGDRLLLCSDGLVGPVSDEEIVDLLERNAEPEKAAAALIERANALGGPDNITVIVGDVIEVVSDAPSATEGEAAPPSDDPAAEAKPVDDKAILAYAPWLLDPDAPRFWLPADSYNVPPTEPVGHQLTYPSLHRFFVPRTSSQWGAVMLLSGALFGAAIAGLTHYHKRVDCALTVAAANQPFELLLDGNVIERANMSSLHVALPAGPHQLAVRYSDQTLGAQFLRLERGHACTLALPKPTASEHEVELQGVE
jgi:serine/threonine protein phosphatase PrpC